MLSNLDNEVNNSGEELISYENMTPEERTIAKNKEAMRVTKAIHENLAAKKEKLRIAKNCKSLGMVPDMISKATGLTLEEIEGL